MRIFACLIVLLLGGVVVVLSAGEFQHTQDHVNEWQSEVDSEINHKHTTTLKSIHEKPQRTKPDPTSTSTSTPTPTHSQAINRIFFASCNRQNQPQKFWSFLKVLQPDVFVWMGDAVYAQDNTLAKLKLAYETFLQNNYWIQFVKNIKIIGTWDDHGE